MKLPFRINVLANFFLKQCLRLLIPNANGSIIPRFTIMTFFLNDVKLPFGTSTMKEMHFYLKN